MTNLVHDRWKIVVDFVRDNDVSDISLWAGNMTAHLEGRIVRLTEEGALSATDVADMIMNCYIPIRRLSVPWSSRWLASISARNCSISDFG